MHHDNSGSPDRLLRLSQIIGPEGLIPVSRATWWRGVKDGRFPKPFKLSSRITVWHATDVFALIRAANDNENANNDGAD